MNKKIKALICFLLCLHLLLLPVSLPAGAEADGQENVSDSDTQPVISDSDQTVAEEPADIVVQYPDDARSTVITISTRDEFLEFAANCRLDTFSTDIHATLAADIDLSGVSFNGIPIFGGILDGGGHTISGFTLDGSGSVQGLFRYLLASAVIRDLNVCGAVAPGGSQNYVGGFAGINSGTLNNCTFEGSVTGADRVGGIVGRNTLTGIIDGCSVSGTVTGDHFVGGIAGENIGVIRTSVNSADINNTAGSNKVDLSTITLESITSSEAAVVATDIGGIAGRSSGVIRSCSNSGAIGYKHIGYNIGGIAGSQVGYITECENHGPVNGRKEVGGIVGQMEPSIMLTFDEDTIQVLQNQLAGMSAMVGTAINNAQSESGELTEQMDELQGYLQDAQDSLEQIAPGGNIPDTESALAALNALSGSLSGMTGVFESLVESGRESMEALSDDFLAISDQMESISHTVSGGSDNLGGQIVDISDADTADILTGKVEGCVNYGTVLADLNVGGIVGAMALENDLDPEDNLNIEGASSLNYSCEGRAVVLSCRNIGTVSSKRQNAGGIAGWVSMGLVRDCVNTGAVEAESARYVGGIAGNSAGYIRECSARCIVGGSTCAGGIAGSGSTVSDCRSMVIFSSGTERLGAVIGYIENIGLGEAVQPIANNYYFSAGNDVGGIDGISYYSAAEPLSEEEFFALENLPEDFLHVTVRFVFDDGTEHVITLDRGDSLDADDIPAIPEKSGCVGSWDGLDDTDLISLNFDAVFPLVYTRFDSIISSDAARESGMPIMIAQGDFTTDGMLTVSVSSNTAPVDEKQTAVESWAFTLPPCAGDVRLRVSVPAGYDTENLTVMVRSGSEEWTPVDFTVEGSYMILDVGDAQELCLVYTPDNHLPEIIIGGSATAALAAATVAVYVSKKRRKNTD